MKEKYETYIRLEKHLIFRISYLNEKGPDLFCHFLFLPVILFATHNFFIAPGSFQLLSTSECYFSAWHTICNKQIFIAAQSFQFLSTRIWVFWRKTSCSNFHFCTNFRKHILFAPAFSVIFFPFYHFCKAQLYVI